jgi:hypothetical protein
VQLETLLPYAAQLMHTNVLACYTHLMNALIQILRTICAMVSRAGALNRLSSRYFNFWLIFRCWPLELAPDGTAAVVGSHSSYSSSSGNVGSSKLLMSSGCRTLSASRVGCYK